jgi:hypothetical protein
VRSNFRALALVVLCSAALTAWWGAAAVATEIGQSHEWRATPAPTGSSPSCFTRGQGVTICMDRQGPLSGKSTEPPSLTIYRDDNATRAIVAPSSSQTSISSPADGSKSPTPLGPLGYLVIAVLGLPLIAFRLWVRRSFTQMRNNAIRHMSATSWLDEVRADKIRAGRQTFDDQDMEPTVADDLIKRALAARAPAPTRLESQPPVGDRVFGRRGAES